MLCWKRFKYRWSQNFLLRIALIKKKTKKMHSTFTFKNDKQVEIIYIQLFWTDCVFLPYMKKYFKFYLYYPLKIRFLLLCSEEHRDSRIMFTRTITAQRHFSPSWITWPPLFLRYGTMKETCRNDVFIFSLSAFEYETSLMETISMVH